MSFTTSFTTTPTITSHQIETPSHISAHNEGPAAVLTPVASVASSEHDGHLTTDTKVAMAVVGALFIFLLVGFCLVARKGGKKDRSRETVLPVTRPVSVGDHRKSVQRWLEEVPAPPAYELTTRKDESRRPPSMASLSGSTIVDVPMSSVNPYLASAMQPLQPLPSLPPAYFSSYQQHAL